MFLLHSTKEFFRLLAKWIGTTAAALFLLSCVTGADAFGSKVTVQLNAYNNDGVNTGTGRLGYNVSIVPTIKGTPFTAVTWSLSGAGSLSASGLYTAPTSMPSNPTVVVTARSQADTSVAASYTFALINPVPYVQYATGWPLPTDTTTALTIVGQHFVPGTTIYVNGNPVPTTFQSTTSVVAKIWTPYNAYGSVQVAAKSSTPGGGRSSAISVPIIPLVLNLNASGQDGTNTGTARLGLPVQFRANVTGSPDMTHAWSVNWSLQGAGSISGRGLYQAPATMPSNTSVKVIATLAANPLIHATYQLTLFNPFPAVNATNPTHLKAGTTDSVVIHGLGFVPGSQVLVGGSPVATTYESSTALVASIPAGTDTRVLVSVENPNPGGNTSEAYSLQVDSPSTVSAVVGTELGRYIQSNFIGLSHEWGDGQWFMGSSKTGVNMIYRQLVQNLIDPGSRAFVIRIGGGTTDTTSYPSSDTVTPFAELTSTLPVHFTLGVNLGSNNVDLATSQAKAYIAGMPSGSVDALEIGNEPDNYVSNGMRSSTYTMSDYLTEFAKWKTDILAAVPSSTKFMGASWGSMLTLHNYMSSFDSQELSSVPTFSQHAYGEYLETQSYPEDYLLSSTAATQGPAAVANYVPLAHNRGQMFRIGEMNSIDSGGTAGISNAFQSALWAIDTMFEYANVGVDGVNWHGTSGCTYCAFTFSTMNVDGRQAYSLQKVNALYYGLLMFHMATGNTSRLLPVTLNTGVNVKVWATMNQSRTAHVIIINKDKSFAGNINISLPEYGDAQVVQLVAPGYQSTDGISIGGQTFDGSVDGKLVGSPTPETISPNNGSYTVTLQPTSAVMLTFTK